MEIESICQEAGALRCAVLRPEEVSTQELRRHYEHWMNQGNGGALRYIDERLSVLMDPFGARPWAKALILVAFRPPRIDDSPLLRLPRPAPNGVTGRIAGYALHEDYHLAGRRILEQVVERLAQMGASRFELCVDSSPVPEKFLAKMAGLGIGAPNSLIRVSGIGCRVYLGCLFTEADLPSLHGRSNFDIPCEECLRCRRACPNHAMTEDGTLRVRACRSWLAGEYRESLSWEQQQALGSNLYGCSICSSCCPEDSLGDEDLQVDCLELLKMPNVVCTPHIGANNRPDSAGAFGDDAAEAQCGCHTRDAWRGDAQKFSCAAGGAPRNLP